VREKFDLVKWGEGAMTGKKAAKVTSRGGENAAWGKKQRGRRIREETKLKKASERKI